MPRSTPAIPQGERSGPAGRAVALVRRLARCRLNPEAREHINRLLAQPVDWTAVLAGARREGLSGLVRRHAVDPDFSPRVPPAVREELDTVYYASAARTIRLLSDTRRLCAALDSARIPVILLKGAFLGTAVYRNIGLRPCQDVDLLIPRSAVTEAHRACVALGYAPDREPVLDAARLDESPFRNTLMYRREEAGQPLFLHVHWHLVNASYPLDVYARLIDLDALWRASRPWTLGGAPVRVLSPAHFLLHLAEHALKHCYEKLILLTDIAEVVEGLGEAWDAAHERRREDIDVWMSPDVSAGPREFWSGVHREAIRFGLDRPLAYALRFAEDLIGARLPPEASELRGLGPVWGTERWFARAVRADVRRGGVNWLAYLAMMDSWVARGRFLQRAIFPPRAALARLDAIAAEVAPVHYWGRFRQAWGRGWGLAQALWAAR
ncbi:MAG: nucleotidyltransferase family protein [Planctomycetes bacterium]|nr:nucleotidyltransferase family protein [Planctomycetota bacterium]